MTAKTNNILPNIRFVCEECGSRMLKIALSQPTDEGDIKLVCPLCSAIDYYIKNNSELTK